MESLAKKSFAYLFKRRTNRKGNYLIIPNEGSSGENTANGLKTHSDWDHCPLTFLFSNWSTLCAFKKNFRAVQAIWKIEGKIQRFPIYHLLSHRNSFSAYQHLLPEWYIVYNWWTYIDKSLSFIIYIIVHFWCYSLYRFRQMYNHTVVPILQFPTEYFHSLKNPLW